MTELFYYWMQVQKVNASSGNIFVLRVSKCKMAKRTTQCL